MTQVSIRLKGMDRILKALDLFPRIIGQHIKQAGQESANEILSTTGLRAYPPSGPGNQPPVPYYIRGRGTQYAGYNDMSSERYGTKWKITHLGYGTKIGNVASYAPLLAGDEQLAKMAAIGWRKLADVAREKLSKITKIHQAWINAALRKVGL